MNPVILPGIIIADGTAAIRAAVIHQDQFKIRKGLRKDAVHTSGKKLLHFIDGDNHADL
jgi:hypothetical protein